MPDDESMAPGSVVDIAAGHPLRLNPLNGWSCTRGEDKLMPRAKREADLLSVDYSSAPVTVLN
jgi:hypothetical protein